MKLVLLLAFVAALGSQSFANPSPPPQIVMNAARVDFDKTVVDAENPLAKAILVKGKERVYGFAPNAVLTRAKGRIIIRAYGAIFIYDSHDVTVRRLDNLKSLPIEEIPEEVDQTIVNLAAERRASVRPASDICPDCIVPVVISAQQKQI